MNDKPLSEFIRDTGRHKREREKVEKPEKGTWELNPQAISRDEYARLTLYGRQRLDRPRPVWLDGKERWTVGAPVNPVEWQILIQSEPRRRRRASRIKTEMTIGKVCGQFQINKYIFSEYVDRLHEKKLLKIEHGLRRSEFVDKWLFPDLMGRRAGGEWHRKSIRDFVEEINRLWGCYTYVDRGFYPGVRMPDVIIIRPELVKYTRRYNREIAPIKWDMDNPLYAEFKSANDMREHPGRLKEQIERYEGVPLYLQVETRVSEAKDWIEEQGRRIAGFRDLLKNPQDDMVFLTGGDSSRSFRTVIKKIKKAFSGTYDRKARLKKTGTDPQGRECHDLILYDSLGTPKNVGQVIPDCAEDVEDFSGLYFGDGYLGRITTVDYVYVPNRKPTPENKTWKWKRTKTQGFRFRSFKSV